MLIRRDDSLLLVVDLQQKLAPAIFEGEQVIANSARLLRGARQLGVPCFISEQYVRGLGSSVDAIRDAATEETTANSTVNTHFFEKTHFSCTAEPGITPLLHGARRSQVILTGTEAHVCVLQTAFGLLGAGFEVHLVADAVSSRTASNRHLAVERMRAAGISIVSTEMVLFEWLHQAGTDEFRSLLPLIK